MGAGNIAGKFVDAARRVEGCDVVAVASKSMERAETFARQFSVKRYYDSYESMLKDGDIDAQIAEAFEDAVAECEYAS